MYPDSAEHIFSSQDLLICCSLWTSVNLWPLLNISFVGSCQEKDGQPVELLCLNDMILIRSSNVCLIFMISCGLIRRYIILYFKKVYTTPTDKI